MENKNYIIYSNLRAETVKKSISVHEMAKSLGVTYNSLKAKLSGKEAFNLDEAFYMKQVFFPETDIYYLFQELIVK